MKDIQVFSSFKFYLKPDQSSLDRLITLKLVNPYLEKKDAGGALLPFPFQPGIGKTFTSTNLLIERMLSSIKNQLSAVRQNKKYEKPLCYYLTDSVENVKETYDALILKIRTQKINGEPRFNDQQQAYLIEQIVYLPNQAQQLLRCENSDIDLLLDRFNAPKDLKQIWQRIVKLKKADVNKSEDLIQPMIQENASKLYSTLISLIQFNQRGKRSLKFDTELQSAINSFAPAEYLRIGAAHIIFLTTKKFLKGFHNSRGRFTPLRALSNTLFVIDEIDRQNEVILKELCQQKMRDLIEGIRSLYANLTKYQLATTPQYQGIETLFDALKIELEDFAARWHIDFAFDIEGGTYSDKPIKLFSDRIYTYANNSDHNLALGVDFQQRKNLITSKIHEQGFALNHLKHGNNKLSKFVSDADKLYQEFLAIMRKAIYRYWQNCRELEPSEQNKNLEGTYEEAISSILNHFNLVGFKNDVYATFDTYGLTIKHKKQISLAKRNYHDVGYKLINIGHNESSVDTVNCMRYSINLSPSGILANMVNAGAVILGVSATAEASTVVHNFDFDYLQNKLGERLLSLDSNERQEVADYYLNQRNYKHHNVELIVKFFESQEHQLKALLKLFQPDALSTDNILRSFGFSDDELKYKPKNLSKLLQSLKAFIKAPNNRYQLLLLNAVLGSEKSKLCDFIGFCCKHWKTEFDIPYEIKPFFGVNAAWTQKSGYQKITDHLYNTTDKVIVFSTYATMGAGKNPDYLVNSKLDCIPLINLGSMGGETETRTDIDALYIEKPSHLLISDETEEINNLLLLHQILSLQARGDISPKEAQNWSFNILNRVLHMTHLSKYHQTADYDSAVRKVLKQGIGRLGRTLNKRPQILLMADADIKSKLAEDHQDPSLFTHEYHALVEQAKQKSTLEHLSKKERRAEIRMQNIAIQNNLYGMEEIKKTVLWLHLYGNEKDIKYWELMREQLLKQPTVAEIQESTNSLYLTTNTGSSYRYLGNLESDGHDFSFFSSATNGYEVNEANSRLPILMQHETVRLWFEKQGFATFWQDYNNVMTPIMFTNIYKGALGEQAIAAILNQYNFKLSPLPANIYERFDFKLEKEGLTDLVWLDSKFWIKEREINPQEVHEKIALVEKLYGKSKFVYINALGDNQRPVRYRDSTMTEIVGSDLMKSQAKIIEIPSLIDQQNITTNIEAIKVLIKWLC